MPCNPILVRVASGLHCIRGSLPLALALGCFLVSLPAAPGAAQTNALTLPRTLDQLVDESHVVIQGWVTRVTVRPHGTLKNLMTVSVTLQLEDSLKGNPPNVFTFTQAILDRTDLQREMDYRPGQHLLLILIKPNSHGLSSPAGMEQGRFRIDTDRQGVPSAVNGFANAGLLRGLAPRLQSKGLRITPELQSILATHTAGPIPLEQLKTLVRAIAGESSKQ